MKFSYPPKFEYDNEPAIWQNPWEFRQTIKVFKTLHATSLLEIGTGYGLFAEYCRDIRGMYVRSIDLEPKFRGVFGHTLVEDSSDPFALEWALKNSPDGYDVVFIDGAHDYPMCKLDYHIAKEVAKKAIMIHDIDANREGKYPVEFGPNKLWMIDLVGHFNILEIHAKEPENCGVGIILL